MIRVTSRDGEAFGRIVKADNGKPGPAMCRAAKRLFPGATYVTWRTESWSQRRDGTITAEHCVGTVLGRSRYGSQPILGTVWCSLDTGVRS